VLVSLLDASATYATEATHASKLPRNDRPTPLPTRASGAGRQTSQHAGPGCALIGPGGRGRRSPRHWTSASGQSSRVRRSARL